MYCATSSYMRSSRYDSLWTFESHEKLTYTKFITTIATGYEIFPLHATEFFNLDGTRVYGWSVLPFFR